MPKKNLPLIAVLIFSVLAIYFNSLDNAFVSDDIAEIVQNPNIGEFSYIFSHPFGFIRLILNWIAFHLGGLTPYLFRSINILFHIGNVLLIFYILQKIVGSRKIAFFVAWIYACHPAISEAVVWISGGTYPQYAFFFLLSFYWYLKSSKKYYWLSLIAYLFAFMSHPVMPLALFLIFPLYEFCFGNLKKNWVKAIPFLVISIGYVLINISVLPERTNTLQAVHYQERGIDNPFVQLPIAFSSYFELTFWPKTLTLYHSELAFQTIEFTLRAIITVLFFVGLLISFKRNKLIFFWLSFFVISLAPTLTPFRFNWVVAERYLYLPIIGIIVVTIYLLLKLFSEKKFSNLVYGLIILLVVVLSIRTVARNVDWHNEDNLWIATGKTSPSSPNTHNNLGDVYGRWGDKQKALAEFQTAIALKPNYADAYHNLANTYREIGNPEQSLENYQNALKFNPNLWQSHQNIAAIYFESQQYDKALENIQKAITINPNVNIVNNLGIIYLAMGEKEKAKEVFTQVLSVDPQNPLAHQGLAEASK